MTAVSRQAMDLIVNRFNGVISIRILGRAEPSFVAEVDIVMIVGKEIIEPATKGKRAVVKLLRNKVILRLGRCVLSGRVSQCLWILVELESKG